MWLLIKINITVNEAQLVSKIKKIKYRNKENLGFEDFFIDTLSINSILPSEFHQIEYKHPRDSKCEMFTSFLNLEVLGTSCTIFLMLSYKGGGGGCTLMSFGMQNPHTFFFLGEDSKQII